MLILFLAIGVVNAVELNDVSQEGSNLITDDANALSLENKLEISSEDSISETNIVNSHDDNLNDYPGDESLGVNDVSYYEDNDGAIQASAGDVEDVTSTQTESTVASEVSDDAVAASPAKVSTKLSVSDTHYSKSATYFKVTLLDKNNKAISNGKITLKVNGVSYSGTSDKNGVASIKTASLKIGSYTVSLSYAGDSSYASSSLSKKVKVLSSVSGSDLNKNYGYVSAYKATFWKNTDALANTKVSFTVNGKTYTRTTDKNGVAKLNINLAPGKYVITTTNPYSKEKLSNNIVVKKDSTTLQHGSAKTYISANKKFTFKVTLKSKHDVLIKNAKVYFTYNNKKVTAKTNENGKASITIPVLSKGTYSISYNFAGDSKYFGSSESGKLYVQDPKTYFKSSVLKMQYKDGSKFTAKLKDSNNKPLANKNVKFTLNGKSYTVKTNDNGNAKLNVGDLRPGTYTIKFKYLTAGSKYYGEGSNKIIISKQTAKLSAGDLKMKYKDGSVYKATLKDKSGNLLKNINVKFTINGKSYIQKTDENGVVSLKINLPIGYYAIKSVVDNNHYYSNTVSKHVLVDGTKFIAGDVYINTGKKVSYSIKAVNGKNNPVKNTKVSFTVDGKTYQVSTNSKGVASVSLGVLSKGEHAIKYSHDSYSGSSKIHVVDKVSIKQLAAASNTVKKYIKKNGKLPSTVKIGGASYSLEEYLYLASKAIINLHSGNKAKIAIKTVEAPNKAKSCSNLGELYDYLAVAKKVIKYADSKGKMPDSVSSDVGTIGYKGIVYAFSSVMGHYSDKGRLPTYVSVKSLSSSSTSTKSLNSKNTIKDLLAYLSSSKNCQVNNAKIKNLVAKLTKGLTNDKDKANAIFKYVRDTTSYSFYYDTKYGAVGTLKAKTGNCVDHSHLLVAMYRAAGLASRYVHGSCTFTSGNTYGHVWTQVLIDNTWTVSDATSSRNSLGKVANWNTNSYKLHGYYASISF